MNLTGEWAAADEQSKITQQQMDTNLLVGLLSEYVVDLNRLIHNPTTTADAALEMIDSITQARRIINELRGNT